MRPISKWRQEDHSAKHNNDQIQFKDPHGHLSSPQNFTIKANKQKQYEL